MQDKGETNSQEKQLKKKRERNNSADLGQGPGSPSSDIHDNIFELFCRYGNPHQMGEVNG